MELSGTEQCKPSSDARSRRLETNSDPTTGENNNELGDMEDVESARTCEHSPSQCTPRGCLHYALQEWRCACLTLLVIMCLCGCSLCGLEKHLSESTGSKTHSLTSTVTYKTDSIYCQTTYIVINAALIFLFYLVYLIECWNSPIWLRSSYFVDPTTAYQWIRHLREAVPSVEWHVSCYHYENPCKHVSKKETIINQIAPKLMDLRTNDDEEDRKVAPTKAHCHKVITKEAERVFDMSRLPGVWDLSGGVKELECHPLVEISMRSEFLFSDERSFQLLSKERRAFYTEFERVDDYMETNQNVRLNPHCPIPERLWVSSSEKRIPFHLRSITFVLAALTLLSYPLRVFIHCRTARLDYTVRKIFGHKPLLLQQQHNLARYCHSIDQVNPRVMQRMVHAPRHHVTHEPRVSCDTNNEAIVLFNYDVTNAATSAVGKKRWQLMHTNSPKRSEKRARRRRLDGDGLDGRTDCDNVDDADGDEAGGYFETDNSGDEDDELLSLDIRYDEFVQNKELTSIVRNDHAE